MSILDSLTDAQREAVTHVDGPMLILAGPGSGKTRVVTHRIAHMIEYGVDPRSILALTFTNKAADEMQARVQKLVPTAPVWVSTFHRFCSRLLRRNARLVGLDANFTIYDTSDSRNALKRAIEAMRVPPMMTSVEALARQISWLKNQMITADDYVPGNDEMAPIIAQVYPHYRRELLRSNAVDFDDLLLHVVAIVRESPELRAAMDETYRYVMVDEYQDTNLAQYAIVRAISNDYPNLAVTGDPDQSIYGWRGANLRNILDFEADFDRVKVVRLEQNYRSTPNILRAAQALISNNVYRKPKELFTANEEGAPVRIAYFDTNTEEADTIVSDIAQRIGEGPCEASDFAIFYRTNALSRSFEHALRAQGIRFQIVNGVEFYQRKEIKDLLAYLQLVNNPQDNNALSRVINVPPRRIGKTTLKRLEQYARERDISVFEAARQSQQISAISKAIRTRLLAFVAMMDDISRAAGGSLEAMLGLVLTTTGYREHLAESPADADQDRVANVDELLQAAQMFDDRNAEPDAVGAFLEQAALVNDTDALGDSRGGVTLMTLHAAKGLEFPVVYIVGLEEGLLPHRRALEDISQLEEERRLLFVGITRAEQFLQLSLARYRPRYGAQARTIQSKFLVELPRSEMDQIGDARTLPRPSGFGGFDETSPIDDLPDYDQSAAALADAGHDDDFDEPAFDVNDETSGTRPVDAFSELEGASQFATPEDESQDPDDANRGGAPILPIKTASQMLESDASSKVFRRVDPDVFELGMTVVEPGYGPGKIAALSGTGNKRQATIDFATVGRKTIIVAFSKLRPA